MKIRKTTKIIFGIVILILAFSIFGTPSYQLKKIKSVSFEATKNRLREAVSTNNEVDISKLTNFQWDECYVFHPYYHAEEAYKKVGVEWTRCQTYLGYLIFHGIENETVSEGQYLIVFKKDNKVILSEVYTLSELPVIFKLNDFKFTKDRGVFTVSVAKEYTEVKIKNLILKK